MTSTDTVSSIQKHIPIMGDMSQKSPISYKATRLMARANASNFEKLDRQRISRVKNRFF
jgi:hypothetical protein